MTTTGTRRPVRNLALWFLQAVAAVGFLLAAGEKLTGTAGAVATFQGLGWPDWTRYALALVELAGSVALLVPRLAGATAVGFVALTIGAVGAQLVTGGSVVAALVLLVVSAVVAGGRRRRTGGKV